MTSVPDVDANLLSAFLDSSEERDPYALYDMVRDLTPLRVPGMDTVLIGKYDDTMAALRHPGLVKRDPARRDADKPGWRDQPGSAEFYQSILWQNPPDHTRLRKLLNRAFTPRRVQALRPAIEQRVEDLYRAMADRGTVDLYADLAAQLPMAVIGDLVGVPDADQPDLRALVMDFLLVIDPLQPLEAVQRAERASIRLREYFADLVTLRRASPRDDLASDLIAVRDGDAGRLSEEELVRTVFILFAAGFETTANLLGNGCVALLQHPDQAALLRDDPSLAAQATEEVLRFDAPLQFVSRVTDGAVSLGTSVIPAESSVVLMLGAANRDPLVFEGPHRLQLTRKPSGIAAFGMGPHYCLGAGLARLEGEVVFGSLLRRFPGIELTAVPHRRLTFNMNGFTTVPVSIS
jgi:cytochrome P450